jgi:hypothetical protein
MSLRPSLLIAGHDPSSVAGQVAFMEWNNAERAQYLKRIEYLTDDVQRLLALLTEPDRAAVLAYRDECASELAWP